MHRQREGGVAADLILVHEHTNGVSEETSRRAIARAPALTLLKRRCVQCKAVHADVGQLLAAS